MTMQIIIFAGVDEAGAAAEPGSESFGLKPEVKAPNISTMIESAFKSGGTGGWGAAADSAGSVPHEQLMEQYVKEKMGGEDGNVEDAGEGSEAAGAAGAGNMLSEEDRLYTIPEDFKKKVGGLGVFFGGIGVQGARTGGTPQPYTQCTPVKSVGKQNHS